MRFKTIAQTNPTVPASSRISHQHQLLASSLNTRRAMLTQFDRARRKYRPRRVRFLLIAESPPSSGGFFYFPTTVGKDHLFRETMKALELWPENKPLRSGVDKRSMLQSFQSLGFYLLDASADPVDKLPNPARRKSIRDQLPRLIENVKRADPPIIVIVKSSIFEPVRSALEEAGFGSRVLNAQPIPFPSHGNQQKYRSMMKKLLGQVPFCNVGCIVEVLC